MHRNGIIKQAMRENVVNSLVDSWYNILVSFTGCFHDHRIVIVVYLKNKLGFLDDL